jgi:hypothetical protein
MKFRAGNNLVLLCVTSMLASLEVHASNTAGCVDPPGGRITCENSQAAFCKVIQGKVDGYCKTPPRRLAGHELSAWVLSEATGERISADAIKADPYATVLQNRQWRTTDSAVRFSMPKGKAPEFRKE